MAKIDAKINLDFLEKEPQKKTLTITIGIDLAKELDRVSDEYNKTKSDIINAVLRHAFHNNKGKDNINE